MKTSQVFDSYANSILKNNMKFNMCVCERETDRGKNNKGDFFVKTETGNNQISA